MELPRLQTLYETYQSQGLEIVAVERNRDTERAKKFIADKGLGFTFVENGEDEEEVVRSIFKVRGFPTSYLIDRQGRIMFFHLGWESGDEATYEEQIKQLL